MSLRRVRQAIYGRRAARTTVFLLLVVAVIVAGLLAMHTFTTSMGNHDASSPAAMVMDAASIATPATMPRDDTATVACSGTCDPGTMGMTMACVLALLFSALLLGAVRAGSLSSLLPRRIASRPRSGDDASLRFLRPPDLNLLSISRT